MVKKSIIQREKKRFFLFNKYKNKIIYYKNIIKNKKKKYSCDTVNLFKIKIQNIPNNAYKSRIRNRCFLTGKPRGYFRRFGLSRNIIRLLSFRGEIPGITKSSW